MAMVKISNPCIAMLLDAIFMQTKGLEISEPIATTRYSADYRFGNFQAYVLKASTYYALGSMCLDYRFGNFRTHCLRFKSFYIYYALGSMCLDYRFGNFRTHYLLPYKVLNLSVIANVQC